MPEQVTINVVDSGVVIAAGQMVSVTAGTGLTGGTITTSGTISVNFGSTAGTVCDGNDSRLTNSRTPSAHANSHASAGSDPVTLDQTQITGLTSALSGKVASTRSINSGTGLTGGGDLTADRTLAVSFGTGSTEACVGNDSRLSNARTPTAHAATHSDAGSDPITISQSQVSGLVADLAVKVPEERQVIAGTGLSGGGELNADVTLSVVYGTDPDTACEGDDVRLSDARTPTGSASGDLSGIYPNPTVSRIRNRLVSTSAVSAGDLYVYSGSQWTPQGATTTTLYTTPGVTSTWTKPTGCKYVTISCVGGGGGGGSGHASASGNRGGGGGGGGGGITTVEYRAADLPATLGVTVGAGGAGGAAVFATANGLAGTAGGGTTVAVSGVTYCYAAGGHGGSGGNNTGGAGGTAQNDAMALYLGGAGGAGGSSVAGTAATNAQGAPGGGGGGGMPPAGTVFSGGNGGARIGIGTVGAGNTGAGGNGVSYGLYGTGGGGSGSSVSIGSAGGAGGRGAGGGGGGSGIAGSGAGGAGGDGAVLIVVSW